MARTRGASPRKRPARSAASAAAADARPGGSSSGTLALHKNEVIQVAQLGVVRPVLEDRLFQDCRMVGPAILAPLDRVEFVGCTWEGEPEAFLFEVSGPRLMIGPIGLRRCRFEGCTFTGIGLIATPDFIKMFRREVRPGT